jgi:S-adenosylmethionine-diacylglycerol 3-amino-3-carboxypropyl transferase
MDAESEVLLITSAGCNALTYLLDDPKTVDCVDINPKQNALLELKIALIRETDHTTFFNFFGHGKTDNYLKTYKQVRDHLSDSSRHYWDTHVKFFSPGGEGLFYQGGSGMFARFLNTAINMKGIRSEVDELLHERDKEARKSLFEKIEERLFSGLQQTLWKTPFVLSLAGIPKSQREAIGDLNQFMKQTLTTLFVEQDPTENHYWKAYFNGNYTLDCCPEYLKPEYFNTLKERVDRISVSTSGMIPYLKQSKKTYSHFVLLDHLDWMAEHAKASIKEEFCLLGTRSGSGAKVLLRTAYPDIRFIPSEAKREFLFMKADPDWVAANDRVGTYTGTWLGTKQ